MDRNACERLAKPAAGTNGAPAAARSAGNTSASAASAVTARSSKCKPGRGVKHHEACRGRIENHLREAGDPRVAAADARFARRVVEFGDPSADGPAEEGGQPAEAEK